MIMRQQIIPLLLAILLLAAPAAALENQPSGLGKAQFGMSPKQIEKIYKGKVRTLDRENLGATPIYTADVVRQVIADEKVAGLDQPTNVELRYWKNKLWVIIVYFGQNGAEAVNEALLKQFGKPTVSSTDLVWQFPKVLVNTSNREHWYALAELEMSKEVQAAFTEDLRKAAEQRQTQQAPAAAPPAAPVPAAK
jgi:hypothetical protein